MKIVNNLLTLRKILWPSKGIMNDTVKRNENESDLKKAQDARKWRLSIRNVIVFSMNHIFAVYGLYLAITEAMWTTIIYAFVLSQISNMGVTAGAHRLWTHRSYKANFPLRLLLLLFFTISYQSSVRSWVRDHRVHHKFCDTDADPHNSRRGFFFSHIGWLLLKKHPDVSDKGRSIDMSDIDAEQMLRIQHKYFFLWVFLFAIIIPAYIPPLWGENYWTGFFVAVILRHTYALHMIFLVNSAAHMWGSHPYDKDICPTENKIVSFLATGEGFHNYHHTFPWDYRTEELGHYSMNLSLIFIDMMAKIGWAYDLKTVPEEIIEKRVMRTGDGSHPVWGWGDKDLTAELKQSAKIL
ncbi:acyl-CoA Delta-9 desaturase-like [Anticarsia gemmatalis]|uniref:acyl-CoA Delta-9 desaturase-like n=1 Tax=Anticarsia gemmatalis TaxID=129554 RepID=UPI003F76BE83